MDRQQEQAVAMQHTIAVRTNLAWAVAQHTKRVSNREWEAVRQIDDYGRKLVGVELWNAAKRKGETMSTTETEYECVFCGKVTHDEDERGYEGLWGMVWPCSRLQQRNDPAGTRRGEVRCPECDRVFDLTDDTDAAEWAYGHDCEC